MFELRGKLSQTQSIVLGIAGVALIVLLWWALAGLFSRQIPVVDSFNTELPSALTSDSLSNAGFRDSILRADSLKLANTASMKTPNTS